MPELPALPECVTAIGEQLTRGDEVQPAPELFQDRKVFAAEFARVFLRPWTAVDHRSRLDGEAGRYFRFEVASRSVVIVRETEDRVHALRNACLHAGYRVCEAEEGTADHLHCVYHDWEYALDGELTAPSFTRRHDASRYRMGRYPLRFEKGLVLVDLTRENAESETPEAPVPDWLGDSVVTGRSRHTVDWNWKYLAHYVDAAPERVLGEPLDGPVVRYGALSQLVGGPDAAALIRIVPRYPERSDVEVVRFGPPGAPVPDGEARVAEGLARAGEEIAAAPLDWLSHDFYGWYWPLMA